MDVTRSFLGMLVLATVFLAASVFFPFLPENLYFRDAAAHAMVEIFGVVSAFFFAFLILIQCRQGIRDPCFYPVALGFISMGILDGFHAISNDAFPGFVWLHSLAVFFGGVFSSLVWAKWRPLQHAWHRLVILASASLGSFFLFYPEALPAIDPGGKFNRVLDYLTVSAGLLFFASSGFFMLRYRRLKGSENLVFATLYLIFGCASAVFPMSMLWDGTWWFWHMLRLAAYGIAIRYCFTDHVRLIGEMKTRISEREASQTRIERLSKLYRALSEVNQAIVRMEDEGKLFPLVCRMAVDFGGLRMAWIGRVNEENALIEPVTSYGSGADYLKGIVISSNEGRIEGRGPAGIAFRENRIVIVNRFLEQEITKPWHEEARRFGWGSSGSFPIPRGGKPFALLGVYHDQPDAFDDEMIELLGEMARDVSFALDSFDREGQAKQTREALLDSERHFRAYFERATVGMAATSEERGWLEVNDALCDMLGYSREELMHMTWTELTCAEDLPRNEALFEQVLRGESDEYEMDKRFIRKNGKIVHVHIAIRAVRKAGGALDYTVALIEDITERRRTENRERLRNRVLEMLTRGAPLAGILDVVVRGVEAENSAMLCSILLLDEEGRHLLTGAAPSLPESYNAAIHGAEIGPGAGSCGTAAYTGERVIVEDIQSHPYWKDYRELAGAAGLASCWSEPIRGASGKVLGTFAIYHREISAPTDTDIALIESTANLVGISIERKHIEEELKLASMVYRNTSEAMMVTDEENRIIAINPAFSQITGYSLSDVIGRDPRILNSGRHDKDFYQLMWREIETTGLWQGEIWNRRKNGEIYPEWLTINTIFNQDERAHRHVALFSDITDKVRTDELIWKQANFDLLTGLPNRRMFYDRLEQEIKKTHRGGLTLALLFIDLDRFKEVNDTLGHQTGDILLIEAARRIVSCVRESDTVARLGGDEFTVILTELPDTNHVEMIAQNIISKLVDPFVLGDEIAYVSASIGITFYPGDALEVEQLLRNADQAMYVSKNAGRNRFSYFTSSMQEAAQSRLRLLNDLRGALTANQFMLYFQPVVDLSTGRIVKAEALLRWGHPDRGMVNPMEFIPLAEETGLIIDIGNWVFREAARWVSRWVDMNHAGFQVSVNESPAQFQSENRDIDAWLAYLEELGLSGRNIVIEITEGLLLNADSNVTDKLIHFRDAGIQVAIDDFGTGYSSLSYLKKFDIDYLKIDRTFVRDLATDPSDMALSEAIIVMAHKLGLKVIAEGVETQEQRDLLAEAGCDCAQGFLFSKPVPPDEFESMLAADRAST
ncbi:MAG: EAL domain-containing protein [Burkholderiales bacterium]|nr:EAL domain-containing protein [Burkholderiales bacterium]